MSNNHQRQSRWGATPPGPAPHLHYKGGGERRDRSQSRNDPRGERLTAGETILENVVRDMGSRGYDTTDAPAADLSGSNRDEHRGRDDSRGRWGDRRNIGGGRPSYGNGNDGRGEDWRCMERGPNNDPREGRHPRCRTWKNHDGPPRDRRSFDDWDRYRDGSRRREGGVGPYSPPSRDGCGRRGREDDYNDRGDRPPRKKTRSDSIPKKREWPPQFEASGASFLFDARSGMFYEPSSDFFYDPKTKLYYSNKKRKYFRYDAEKKPHVFQPIGGDNGVDDDDHQQQEQVGGQGVEGGVIMTKVMTEAVAELAPPVPNSNEAIPNATESKSDKAELKIAISLKTALSKDTGVKSLHAVTAMERTKLVEKTIQRKELSLSTSTEKNATVPTLSQSHKNHAMDIHKWSERVKEIRSQGNVNEDSMSQASKKIKTTASGQPICIICRRKFANVEKLRQHEKLSVLHKENLSKKAVADATAFEKKQDSEAPYRDRSKERRMMYGGSLVVAAPDSSVSHAEALLARTLGAESKPAEVIRPEETLNEANLGNKLLQKLGWKSGEALGKSNGISQDAFTMTAESDGSSSKKNDDVVINLKNDWERIESLAQRGGGMRQS